MALQKYPALHELEARHGVDLGQSYTTKDFARSTTLQSQQLVITHSLSASHFYSFLTNGTTDAGNIEDELVVIMYCERDVAAGETLCYA